MIINIVLLNVLMWFYRKGSFKFNFEVKFMYLLKKIIVKYIFWKNSLMMIGLIILNFNILMKFFVFFFYIYIYLIIKELFIYYLGFL